MSTFASVVLDMDSTLSGVEGVDWLATRCGAKIAREVAALTTQAMEGVIQLDQVYGSRLSLIRPSAKDIATLASVYTDHLAPGASAAIEKFREAGVRVVIVSGGLRQAILPCAAQLGFADESVCAVGVYFDDKGEYAGFEKASPLATQHGKPDVVKALALPEPIIAVGDGATDAALRSVVDSFAAFTGFVRREPVVLAADRELHSFDELLEVVLP